MLVGHFLPDNSTYSTNAGSAQWAVASKRLRSYAELLLATLGLIPIVRNVMLLWQVWQISGTCCFFFPNTGHRTHKKKNIHTYIKYKALTANTCSSPRQPTAWIPSTRCAQTQCNTALPLSLYRHILSRQMPHSLFSRKLRQHEPHQTWVAILSFSSSHWVQPFQQRVARLNSEHDYLLVIIPSYVVSIELTIFPHAVLEIEVS